MKFHAQISLHIYARDYYDYYNKIMNKSIGIQTEQFLNLLTYQDKLTKLYLHIKKVNQQNQQYANKIEYLQFKVQAMEESLYDTSLANRNEQESRNRALIRDVIELEEQLLREKQELQGLQMKIANSPHSPQFPLKEQFNDSDISLHSPHSSHLKKIEKTKTKNDEIQQMSQQITKLQKQNRTLQNWKKMAEMQNRRLRKLNEEYSIKNRRLQQLDAARSKISYSKIQNIDSSVISIRI